MDNIFYNTHHSPIGAMASFTLGFKGAKGGLGQGLCRPADTNVYIGLQNPDGKGYKLLPFFSFGSDESRRYDLEKTEESDPDIISLKSFRDNEIQREFKLCTDKWIAGNMTFTVYSQVRSVTEPCKADPAQMKEALVPAVLVEIEIDNTKGASPRRAIFGYDGSDPYDNVRHVGLDDDRITGIGQGSMTAIIAPKGTLYSCVGFSAERILNETIEVNWLSGIGNTALLIMDTPSGCKKTYRFAVCFYRTGYVTTGIKSGFEYTRLFSGIEDAGAYALENFEAIKGKCLANDREFFGRRLSADQEFMAVHAIRSYYASTQMLNADGKTIWVVNEGEYRMMNTLDLTVDQVFFETAMNPWTVRNVLDFYLERYSYRDTVSFPGDHTQYPGGLTFTHDMGTTNVFSRPGYSSYERSGLDGCFSYMSHEQLVNWLCCALVYLGKTRDADWLKKRLDIFIECFKSMLNRDNPDSAKRNGMMGLDSSRTAGGAEITTYDSLDVSLGQARNNIYLAGKCWAVYVALEKLFAENDLAGLSKEAGRQAELCASSVAANISEEGFIPAVLNENNVSKIIPAVEGLVFPRFTGCEEALDENGRFGQYIGCLKKHLKTVLVKGSCIFGDDGWKLSSTSNNSWLSKIYLCQYITRSILGINGPEVTEKADRAHVFWLKHPEHSYWSWSDQIVSGVITGSKYYPRGVTCILWLDEN